MTDHHASDDKTERLGTKKQRIYNDQGLNSETQIQ